MEDQTTSNLIIGETCLFNVQLRRLGITFGPHNIFDNALVNLDSVKLIVENDFRDMISSCDFKNYTFYPEHNITYSKFISDKYSLDEDNIFSWEIFSHFHTDSLTPDVIASLERKIDRTKLIFKSKTPVKLFYYYRFNKNYNIDKIKEKVSSFLSFIKDKYAKRFELILLTNETKGIRNYYYSINGNVTHIHIESPNSWIGIDDNWDAKSENDIFDELRPILNENIDSI